MPSNAGHCGVCHYDFDGSGTRNFYGEAVKQRRDQGMSNDQAFAALEGVSELATEDHTLRMRVAGSIAPVVREASKYDLVDFVSREPSLEETFLAQYGRDTAEAGAR